MHVVFKTPCILIDCTASQWIEGGTCGLLVFQLGDINDILYNIELIHSKPIESTNGQEHQNQVIITCDQF